MIDQSARESVQATEIQREASGATVEYTDVRLVNGTYWNAPPKICRGDVLLALDKEQSGIATRLCLDLLVDNWNQVAFGPVWRAQYLSCSRSIDRKECQCWMAI